MAIEPTDPTVNREAIPTEQPIAASPGPQGERKPRSPWRSGWTILILLLVILTLLGALHRHVNSEPEPRTENSGQTRLESAATTVTP